MTRARSPYLLSASRPMVRTWLFLVIALTILPALFAAPPAAPAPAAPTAQAAPILDPLELDKKILAEAKNGSEIMPNLTYLSDMIGPRLTGSAALKKANDWTAKKMREYGLSNVHLEGWELPVAWERGPASMRIIEPEIGRSLTVAAMAWTPGTKGKITCDVVVINASNAEEWAKLKEQLKGKLKNAVVLTQPPRPIGPVAQYGSRFLQPRPQGAKDAKGKQRDEKGNKQDNGKADTLASRTRDFEAQRAFRREISDFLRKEGAAVLLTDSGKPHGLLNMTGSWRSFGASNDRVRTEESIPTLFITHEHYTHLYRLATRPAPARTRVEVEIENKFIEGPLVVYNTVGEIPGTEKPDEVVLIGAHLDSWDLGQGTTDNGTGSCVVLETARTLMKCGIRPKRTIRFVLFTGEEQGLVGSAEYVKKHKDELAKMSMALVHDTGTGKVVGLYMHNREVVKPIFEKELVSLKPLGLAEYNMNPMGGTDHASFDRANVPGFAVQQERAEYPFTHHSQSDTLDKAHEPDLIQGAQVLAVAAVRVANLPSLLPRDKPAGADRPRRFGGEKKEGAPAKQPAAEKK
jgi:carboxypeptidase Q